MKEMRRIAALTLTTLALMTGAAHASDAVGIYARVDRVVLEPGPDVPERIPWYRTRLRAWASYQRRYLESRKPSSRS